MPVSKKKKYPQKHSRPEKQEFDGYELTIHDSNPSEKEKLAFRIMGFHYYNCGRGDNESGEEALSVNEFIERLYASNREEPDHSERPIILAQYSQYIDGYKGAEYCERVHFQDKS